MTPIKNREIHKALKTVLSLNYRYRLLDFAITPKRVDWYFALQFKNDADLKWHPRIVCYFPHTRRAAILSRIGDPEPVWVDAATLLAMAELKKISPNPPPNPPNSLPPLTYA